MAIVNFNAISQSCIGINSKINFDYSYENKIEGISIPFNEDWSIIMENENAILVSLSEKTQLGTLTIIKNRNKFEINSAHDFTKKMIDDYLNLLSNNTKLKGTSKVYLHNIKSLQLEYNYKVFNLNETTIVEGLSFIIVKGNYTFFFLFNCEPVTKTCFFPFYKEIMKNTVFNQQWF